MEHNLHTAINTLLDEMKEVADMLAYMGTSTVTSDEAVNEGQRSFVRLLEVKVRNNIQAVAAAMPQPGTAPNCSNS